MFDFSPLIRSSAGFDRVFDRLENAARAQQPDHWPPYDIVKTGEDQYAIICGLLAGKVDGDGAPEPTGR